MYHAGHGVRRIKLLQFSRDLLSKISQSEICVCQRTQKSIEWGSCGRHSLSPLPNPALFFSPPLLPFPFPDYASHAGYVQTSFVPCVLILFWRLIYFISNFKRGDSLFHAASAIESHHILNVSTTEKYNFLHGAHFCRLTFSLLTYLLMTSCR